MDQFVCVRLVKANAMDLSLLQFDYDLTFAVVMMNGDRTVYGRFGSRSSEHAEKDISLDGFAAALSGALELHQEYPANKSLLTGKQPRPSDYRTPDDLPSLQGKYQASLDYQGQLVRSCLHCHQIRDAQRDVYRRRGDPLPDKLLFPFPGPSTIGFTLDAASRAQVDEVQPDSMAARAGLEVGDEIVSLAGQPILSAADVQWVLEQASDEDALTAAVERAGARRELTLQLQRGWRRASDISWRVSTWPLRRMGLGGLVLETVPVAERSERPGDADESLGLRVKHVGQYGPHAEGKRAGFAVGDQLLAFDGQRREMTESQLLAYAAQHTVPGQEVVVAILRDGQRTDLMLRMQE